MEKQSNTLVLEASSNTHVLHGVENATEIAPSILKVTTIGEANLVHGEHGTLKIESKHCVKYIQQELNVVTGAMQNAFD
jgi:hypothetical protein